MDEKKNEPLRNDEGELLVSFSADEVSKLLFKRSEMAHAMMACEDYLKIVTSALHAEKQGVEAVYREPLRDSDPEGVCDEVVDAYLSEVNYINSTLSNLHYTSVFVTSLSFVEVLMNDLCELYRAKLNLAIKYQDLKGSGPQRAAVYLKKVVDLPVLNDFGKGHPVVDLYRVRGNLVHGGMDFKSLDEEYLELLQSYCTSTSVPQCCQANLHQSGRGAIE